jgi:hypothetical protein
MSKKFLLSTIHLFLLAKSSTVDQRFDYSNVFIQSCNHKAVFHCVLSTEECDRMTLVVNSILPARNCCKG